MSGFGVTDWIATFVLGASNYCIELPAVARRRTGKTAATGGAPAAAHACVRGTGTKAMTLATTRTLLVASLACVFALCPSLGGPAQAKLVIAGVLERAMPDSCVALSTLDGYILLDNLGQFGIGDSVVAAGDYFDYASCGYYELLHLPANSIDPLNGCDLGCGLLTLDTEYFCPILYTDRFGAVLLDSYGEFASGDSVHVVGDFAIRTCTTISECTPDYCLERNTTTACTLTPVPPSTWGRLKGLFR
jgi:hypothetical protein